MPAVPDIVSQSDFMLVVISHWGYSVNMSLKTIRPPAGTFALACLLHRERLRLTVSEVCGLFPGLDGKPLSWRTWTKWETEQRTPPGSIQKLIIDQLSKAKSKKDENNSK